jgi:hypothetical protein
VGVLTETAMRLRDEIVDLRHARVALRGDLVRQTDERRTRVAALCAGFARDRAGALRAWCGPTRSERQTAERPVRRKLAEEATAKAQEKQSPAPPKMRPQRRAVAKAVTAPRARPPVAPLPHTRKPRFKGPKKH